MFKRRLLRDTKIVIIQAKLITLTDSKIIQNFIMTQAMPVYYELISINYMLTCVIEFHDFTS